MIESRKEQVLFVCFSGQFEFSFVLFGCFFGGGWLGFCVVLFLLFFFLDHFYLFLFIVLFISF